MKHLTNRSFYWLSLTVLLLLSAYPLYMGVKVLSMVADLGYLDADLYPRYVIPYAPMCLGILAAVALRPLLTRMKKWTLPVGTFLGVSVFLVAERLLERIPIGRLTQTEETVDLQTWQLALCRSLTPEEIAGQTRVVENVVYAENNVTFKFHFYLIALVILLAVVSLVYAYAKMIREQNFSKKRPLTVQLICTVTFIGLCVWACFTAFYRTGDIRVSPVSALLMCVFFSVFGVTFGSYLGSLLYGRAKRLSVWLPAAVASLTVVAMYVGELMLMGGELFVLGHGFLFDPVAGTPFALTDLFVILFTGAVTGLLMRRLNKRSRTPQA